MAFKKATRLAIFGTALCLSFNAAAQGIENPASALTFHNLHTKENITFQHVRGQKSVDPAVNHFMRDFRRNEPANMDPALFDLIVNLKAEIQKRYPRIKIEFHTISAYRAPVTNQMLRSKGGSQAQDSRHSHGDAIDIRVPGVTTSALRDIATCLRAGGVGYYAADGFVHVDTSRVRYWPSRDYLSGLRCK